MTAVRVQKAAKIGTETGNQDWASLILQPAPGGILSAKFALLLSHLRGRAKYKLPSSLWTKSPMLTSLSNARHAQENHPQNLAGHCRSSTAVFTCNLLG